MGWHLDWALPAVRAASRLALMLAVMVLLGWHLREEYKQLLAGVSAAGAPAAGAPAADAVPDDPPEYVHDDFAHNPAEAPPATDAVPPENGVQMGAVFTGTATGEEEWS